MVENEKTELPPTPSLKRGGAAFEILVATTFKSWWVNIKDAISLAPIIVPLLFLSYSPAL